MIRVTATACLILIGCSQKATEPVSRCYPQDGACDSFASAVGGPADLELGARLFKAQCATCHGPDGRANGLKDRPDLTSAAWRDRWSDEEVMGIVAAGRGTRMPGFRLSPSEMKSVVAWIRTLAPKAVPPPSGEPKSYGPR